MKIVKLGNVERMIPDDFLDKFEKMGYKEIGNTPDFRQEEHRDETMDLESMTADKLKSYAKELGIVGYSSLTKKELLKAIRDHSDGADDYGEEDEDND